MALCKRISFLLLLLPFALSAQYTDVINSNRPGQSVSAYAVGKNVVQAEVGLSFEQQDHADFNTESKIIGSELSLRYGLFFENLEINYEGTFVSQNIDFLNFGTSERRSDFTRNRLGLKYLVYDPFKNPEANKPNLYSWRANHKFQWKNLLPAISVYGGATFNLGENPFFIEDPTLSYRAMVATQSRLTPRWVLITNIAYDRISTDFPELNYIISVSHAFRNPKWSIFGEHQGIDSDRYSDALFRSGIAHLFTPNFQVDASIGVSIKNTPSRYFANAGLSYRLDFHKDQLIQVKDEDSEPKIKKDAWKGKTNKKEKRKKKKRKKKKNNGEIDF